MKEVKKLKTVTNRPIYIKESSSSKTSPSKPKNYHKLQLSCLDISKPAWYVDINRGKYSNIPKIKWKTPVQFELNTKWKVAAGEDSYELECEMPNGEVGPTSPKHKWDDDSLTPVIPTDELPDEPESPRSSSEYGESSVIAIEPSPVSINSEVGLVQVPAVAPPDPSALKSSEEMFTYRINDNAKSEISRVGPVFDSRYDSLNFFPSFRPDARINPITPEVQSYGYKAGYGNPGLISWPVPTYGRSFNPEAHHAPPATPPVPVSPVIGPGFRPEAHQSQTWNNRNIVPPLTPPAPFAWNNNQYRPLNHQFNQPSNSMVVPPNALQPNWICSPNPLLASQPSTNQELPPKDYSYYKSLIKQHGKAPDE